MEIRTRTTDRKALIDFLEAETGQRAQYLGAPGFQYVIGPFTVLRNADIRTDDVSGERLLADLELRGFAEEKEKEDERGIVIPMDPEEVTPKVNLLNMVSARGLMISKAIGRPGALQVSAALIRTMQMENPADSAAFHETMAAGHAGTELRGIRICSDRAVFTGFPLDGPDAWAARDLAEAMVRAARKQSWVKPVIGKAENEKYAFRSWLLTLGMKGEEYAGTRAALLARLDGDATYRTADQKRTAVKKRKEKRRRKKNRESRSTLGKECP